jgi:hypothetical protein
VHRLWRLRSGVSVEAIFALDETPEKWKNFISVNAQHFQK